MTPPTTRTESLASLASPRVSQKVKSKGAQYFDSGTVSILDHDEDWVQAAVRGTHDYDVTLEFDEQDRMLEVSCTCPHFEDRFAICKHIWATLLACDSDGLLRTAVEDGGFVLVSEHDDDEPEYLSDSAMDDISSRVVQMFAQRQPREPDPKDAWRQQISSMSEAMRPAAGRHREDRPADRQIIYIVDVTESLEDEQLTIEIASRQRKADGQWGKIKSRQFDQRELELLPEEADRHILSLLQGSIQPTMDFFSYRRTSKRYRLPRPSQPTLLRLMCETGRCMLRSEATGEATQRLEWDDGGPWRLWLEVEPASPKQGYSITGSLRREDQRMAMSEPALLLNGGLVFARNRAAVLDDAGAFPWISLLRQQDPVIAPVTDAGELIETLLGMPCRPQLQLPESLSFEQVQGRPRPRLVVRSPEPRSGHVRLIGDLSFEYGGRLIDADHPVPHVYQADERRLLARDPVAEREADAALRQLGFRDPPAYLGGKPNRLTLMPSQLGRVVKTLVDDGWLVEAEGKRVRRPGQIDIKVRSGIDWFELHGQVEFDETGVGLPELLQALQRGDKTVRLDDGTMGVLPEEWLARYGVVAGMGVPDDGHVRFAPSQVGLLDALLAAMPEASWDEKFAEARDRLRRFEGVEPADPPKAFSGKLRGYQRDGLGWLYFLQRFGFGGCLADDMGLGKTVQVLALLESRRQQRRRTGKGEPEPPRPSLVVVPRSLVFNWRSEAARFTPGLRVLSHTGIDRQRGVDHFRGFDLVLTTYGTLRRDIAALKDARFDYVILDEAQAIKNARTASAKAVRLLRGEHRLALTGTPIENHLGDLWSLFDFLNPGILGTASVFKRITDGSSDDDDSTRRVLAGALRPLMLRRTKEQVAKDLPQKVEQTSYCELPARQRKAYNELRDHYRRSLLKRVDRTGINKSKIQVLEALLRLRQAACHPGLIDKARSDEPSAKLDLLLSQLTEVIEEGHKALVFSQFTSLLSIVRDRLDGQGVIYEYLDGRTRKRAPRIERFQTDPDCRLFLISLKAGGLGLNLTAADYVFLLDPWWNPAVEAQAIDRAHRIGQTRQVFAYRLIARDTVEEKVLEIQKSKRALADAIIKADAGLIRNLSRKDLELLLS